MTLALGTSLQHGTYVIDALSGEDSIGPLYLATHVPSGQWVLVRVLGSRHPESLPDPTQRTAFYQSLESLNQRGQTFLPKNLRGFEEDRVCYQTFSLPQGSPLSQGVTPQTPRSLGTSLTLIQTLAQALLTLKSFGWAGLRVSPDQVWQGPGEALTFTGFDFPASQSPITEADVVRGLTECLYFLLTGQRAAQAPLGVDLRYRRPELPASLDALFQWERTSPAQPPSLNQWLALLPNPASLPTNAEASHRLSEPKITKPTAPAPTQTQRTEVATVVAAKAAVERSAQPSLGGIPTSTQPPAQRQGPRMTWALLATGLVFGLGGITFGLQARLHPTSPAAQTRFNPNQAFPPLPNWNSRSPGFDDPTVEGRRSRLSDRMNPSSAPAASPASRPRPTSDSIAPPVPAPDTLVRPQSPAPNVASPAVSEDAGEMEPNGSPNLLDNPTPAVEAEPSMLPREVAPDPTPAPVQSAPEPAPEPPSAPAPVAPAPAEPVAPPPPLAPAPAPPAPPTPLTSS